MIVEINFKSGTPAYLQIVEQVRRASATGSIRPGDQLPSIRELAERLRINRNTVAKTYSELEHEGLVETLQGRGVFVNAAGRPLPKAAREGMVGQALDAAIIQAHHLRVDHANLKRLLEQRIQAFEDRKEENR
jgi:GntR family transcriptional regulator